jgi:hypothetical protein
MSFNELADAIIKASESKSPTEEGLRAYLGFKQTGGNYEIPVEGSPGYVWVRIEDGQERTVTQAWNEAKVEFIPDLPIRVKRDKTRRVVIGMDSAAPDFLGDAIGLIGTGEPGSGKMQPISARRLLDGLIGVHPDGGKQVYVYPFAYNYDGIDYYYSGGTLDLTSYWPTTGNKRWIKLGFDPVAAAPVAVAGSDFTPLADIPESNLAEIAFDGYFSFAGVQVIGDQSGVISERQFTDFTPWRSGAGYQDWDHVITMAGRSWGGQITDNGDGTVAIAAGQGLIKEDEAGAEDLPTSYLQGQGSRVSVVSWDAVSSLAITADAYNYIYYDGSADVIAATTDFSAISFTRDFTLGRVYKIGATEIIIRLCGVNLWNYDRRNQLSGDEIFGVVLASGGVVSETGTRYLQVTAGALWAETVNRFSTTALDTSATDTFRTWWQDGVGGWNDATGNTQVDNLQYDDGSGTLATLTANRYGVHWVYLVHDSSLHLVYGQDDYTLGNAELASPPASLPGVLAAYATIIAKIIVRKSATNLLAVQAPDPTSFSASGAADHGGLSGLGDDDHTQYYNQTRGDARYAQVGESFVVMALSTDLTAERVLTAGTGITITDGGAGSTVTISSSVTPGLCEGRLSLDSSDPVPTTDLTAKTTVYFLPYKGDKISIYSGSAWEEFDIGSGVNVAVPSTTTTPFDVFAYDNSGSLAIETLDWTNDTTRATALATQDGVYVKTGDTGRRYLGTGRTTGTSGQCEDSEANRLLWNYYNRVLRNLYYVDSTTHTYATATWREWNGVTNTHMVYAMIGVVEEKSTMFCFSDLKDSGRIALGLNTTSINSTNSVGNTSSSRVRISTLNHLAFSLGYNYIAIVEYASSGTATFYGATIGAGFYG